MAKSLEDMTVPELLEHAKGLQSRASFFDTVTKNPETRETVLRALKKAAPSLPIPEIDAADRVAAMVGEERKARIALEERLTKEAAERTIAERKQKAINDYKLTPADVEAIEKQMLEENGILNYDAAARVHVASKQSATPTPASWQAPTRYEMPEKEIWAGGIGNPARLTRIAMEEASKAMNEMLSGKVAGLGSARAN
jgi:hypothetical protein